VNTHVYIHTNVYESERDDDCHISDNVPRCSYNNRIYIDTITQMSKIGFLLHKKMYYYNISLLTFQMNSKTMILTVNLKKEIVHVITVIGTNKKN